MLDPKFQQEEQEEQLAKTKEFVQTLLQARGVLCVGPEFCKRMRKSRRPEHAQLEMIPKRNADELLSMTSRNRLELAGCAA